MKNKEKKKPTLFVSKEAEKDLREFYFEEIKKAELRGRQNAQIEILEIIEKQYDWLDRKCKTQNEEILLMAFKVNLIENINKQIEGELKDE